MTLTVVTDFEDQTVLQIRRSNKDDLGIIIHISSLDLFCDPLLELSLHFVENAVRQKDWNIFNFVCIVMRFIQ